MNKSEVLIITLIIVVLLGLTILILTTIRTGKLCQFVTDYETGVYGKGLSTTNGITAFRYTDSVDTLFHEVCHQKVFNDYEHFCEEIIT